MSNDTVTNEGILDGLGGLTLPKRKKPMTDAEKIQQQKEPKVGDTFELPMAQIIVQEQVRKKFDMVKLRELASLIAMEGQRSPLEVAKLGTNQYLLITGERRFRALGINDANTARVTLVNMPEGEHNRIALQLTENLQRDDLTPLELAAAFDQLKTLNWSQNQIAKAVGKTAGWVSRYINLIGLPDFLSRLLEEGHTADTQIVTLLRKINEISPDMAIQLAQKVESGTTSRQQITDAYEALKSHQEKQPVKSKSPSEVDLNRLHYERPHKLIRPDKFRAMVEARLSNGDKVTGSLMLDRLAESSNSNEMTDQPAESWCWIELTDGTRACVQTVKIKIMSVKSV